MGITTAVQASSTSSRSRDCGNCSCMSIKCTKARDTRCRYKMDPIIQPPLSAIKSSSKRERLQPLKRVNLGGCEARGAMLKRQQIDSATICKYIFITLMSAYAQLANAAKCMCVCVRAYLCLYV